MIQYRVYKATDDGFLEVPSDKRFFCLPHFLLDGKMAMTFFCYGATAEEAEDKAREFWEAELAKARRVYGKNKKVAKGRPETSAITAEMLAKIDDDFDPKG